MKLKDRGISIAQINELCDRKPIPQLALFCPPNIYQERYSLKLNSQNIRTIQLIFRGESQKKVTS